MYNIHYKNSLDVGMSNLYFLLVKKLLMHSFVDRGYTWCDTYMEVRGQLRVVGKKGQGSLSYRRFQQHTLRPHLHSMGNQNLTYEPSCDISDLDYKNEIRTTDNWATYSLEKIYILSHKNIEYGEGSIIGGKKSHEQEKESEIYRLPLIGVSQQD